VIARLGYKFSPDSNSEISLKIGQYLTKFRRTKKVCQFFFFGGGHTVYALRFRRWLTVPQPTGVGSERCCVA